MEGKGHAVTAARVAVHKFHTKSPDLTLMDKKPTGKDPIGGIVLHVDELPRLASVLSDYKRIFNLGLAADHQIV
jgi:hypothetical protein